MLDIDQRWLVDEVTIVKKSDETDDWGKPISSTPETFKNVRFYRQNIYSGTENNRSLLSRGTVFLYPKHTEPMPKIDDTYMNATINFDGHEYTIKDISIYECPASNKIFSYEFEVI